MRICRGTKVVLITKLLYFLFIHIFDNRLQLSSVCLIYSARHVEICFKIIKQYMQKVQKAVKTMSCMLLIHKQKDVLLCLLPCGVLSCLCSVMHFGTDEGVINYFGVKKLKVHWNKVEPMLEIAFSGQ